MDDGMRKFKVGVVGATGMVGQRFVSLLEHHPWFELAAVAASPRSAGKTYAQAVGEKWAMPLPIPENAKELIVLDASDVQTVAARVDFVFCAVEDVYKRQGISSKAVSGGTRPRCSFKKRKKVLRSI